MTDTAEQPLWRSLLFVPATAERFVAKVARHRGVTRKQQEHERKGYTGAQYHHPHQRH